MVIGEHRPGTHRVGRHADLFVGLAQGRVRYRFVTVAGTPGQSPGAPVMRPLGTVLQQHPAVHPHQQTGRAVQAPVSVSGCADTPAVAVTAHGVERPGTRILRVRSPVQCRAPCRSGTHDRPPDSGHVPGSAPLTGPAPRDDADFGAGGARSRTGRRLQSGDRTIGAPCQAQPQGGSDAGMSMGRHRDALGHSGRRHLSPGAITVIVLLALVAGTTVVYLRLSRPNCRGSAIAVTVAADDDIATSLSTVADSFNRTDPAVRGRCVRIDVADVAAATVVSALTHGWQEKTDGPRPDVWVPASTSWIRVAQHATAAAAVLPATGTPLARTPVVLGMPGPVATASKWSSALHRWSDLPALASKDRSWRSYGHPEWGPIRLAMADPGQDTAALLAALAISHADTATDTATDTAAVRALRGALSIAPASTGDLLTGVASTAKTKPLTYVSAFPVTERDLLQYDRTNPTQQWVAVYPAGGGPVADHPFTTLKASWVGATQRRAAADFAAFARRPLAQQTFTSAGFRGIDGTHPDGLGPPAFRTTAPGPVHPAGTPAGAAGVIAAFRGTAQSPAP